ncbi:hypothetical protein GCM10010260_58580 [Streptomyces filipinensis]|uniref:Uncharacterized protein n=1 Tax=Streptomyces filipinensis TaxID=66887 RepID=A0A918MD58_9ACTN|nr:hypothetical protein [Streptomyces filipinensis]GGV12228.1 hypothetical protein GCM10010260_58580 [Streptomyces filipinensis]
MSGQPYAVRLSLPAAKALDVLPEHAEQMAWDVLDAAAANPWGFPQHCWIALLRAAGAGA